MALFPIREHCQSLLTQNQRKMALKNQFTTADYIDWNEAMNLVRRLYRDKNYRMSLFVGCGCFFGLRYSDLSRLTWGQMLSEEKMVVFEQKTGKRREIRINKGFQRHIKDCKDALEVVDLSEPCFISRAGSIYTIQAMNRNLKLIKSKYGLHLNNFSTHSLRKTFGRRVVEMAGADSEMALIRLSEIFQHSSVMITRRYLGLRQQELGEIYNCLQF